MRLLFSFTATVALAGCAPKVFVPRPLDAALLAPQGAEVVEAEREQAVLLGEADRDLLDQILVDRFDVDRAADLEAELVRHAVEHFVRVQQALFDQDVREPLVALELPLASATIFLSLFNQIFLVFKLLR